MQNINSELRKLKISVAVVFYDPTLEDVKLTLSNIKVMQSMNDYTFFFYLIDNASPNRRLSSLLPKDLGKNVFYKELKENKGFGAGHNLVLDIIDSDYHIVMNPDIEFDDTGGMIKALRYMKEHSEVGLLSPLVRNTSNGDIQLLNREKPTVFDLFIRFLGPNFFPQRQSKFVKKKNGYDHIQLSENATGSFMIFSTNLFKKIGGFDERFFMYFEDTDITGRISEKYKAVFFPYLTVKHSWRRGNHSLKGLIPMISSMVTYFNKWGWRWI